MMNGVDVRSCIDYRLVDDLAQLMVHPMHLINELLVDLDITSRNRSLNMASGFLNPMNKRERRILAFSASLNYLNGSGFHLGSRMRLRYTRDCWIMLYMVFYEFHKEPI